MSRIAQRRFAALGTWHWALVAIAGLAVAYAGWHQLASAETAVRSPALAEVPVHVATAERKPFPLVLNGLGTVQATNVVTVRSRVDGQIEKVAFGEGQIVKEGDLLVQIDPAPFKASLDQAVAKLAQDQASLTNAKQDLNRTTTLSKQGDATLQLLDQRTANVASLNAQLQADQAAIESAKVQLAYTTIRSPLTGRAGFRLIDPGNIVHATDQNGMLTITQLQPISVIFTAPEQDLPAVSGALKSDPLKVTAYSSDGKKALAVGTLKLIDNQVDVASGTIRLKASFDNADNALWPGLSVSTRLLVSTVPDAVLVTDNAVQRGPSGLYVYVVTPDSKAELRNVTVGPIEGGQALIEKGLSPGERVVTSGHYKVLPGGPVQVLQEQRTAETPAAGKVE
jgi:membrane fusion protein, multidrug efflux system